MIKFGYRNKCSVSEFMLAPVSSVKAVDALMSHKNIMHLVCNSILYSANCNIINSDVIICCLTPDGKN